jgi:hypothetical protein
MVFGWRLYTLMPLLLVQETLKMGRNGSWAWAGRRRLLGRVKRAERIEVG